MTETRMKKRKSRLVAIIWEGIGVLSIILLIYMPNGKTIFEIMCESFHADFGQIYGMSSVNIIGASIFLTIYFSSFKIFPKESCTKLFSIVTSAMMIITLVSAILFT